jgi:RND family efflux transporter MFP subunit
MDFVDNVIDRATGTIRGRAVLSNPTGVFTPGMFARVRVPGSPAYHALLVPEAAIGSEQTRKFLSVVDADNIVRQKYVALGQAVGDLRVIRDGLTANDRVVTKGLVKARPGQKITPLEANAPPQQASPPPSPASPQAAAAPQASGSKAD